MTGKWQREGGSRILFYLHSKKQSPCHEQIKISSTRLLLLISGADVHRVAFKKHVASAVLARAEMQESSRLAFCWPSSPPPLLSWKTGNRIGHFCHMTRNRTQTGIFLDKQIWKQCTKFQMFSLTHYFQVIATAYWVHKRHYYQPVSVNASFGSVNPCSVETMDCPPSCRPITLQSRTFCTCPGEKFEEGGSRRNSHLLSWN